MDADTYTYLVLVRDDKTLDIFYECEYKKYTRTPQEWEITKAVIPDLLETLSEEDKDKVKKDVYMCKFLDLRARFACAKFKIIKTPIPVTREIIEEYIRSKK